jgi:spermidine synthase
MLILKWLSYLTEITLEQRESDISGHLTVSLHKGRHCLSTENAIYSWADLYTNFYTVFKDLRIEENPPQDILVLGLGLASIPWMLEKNFHLKASYTAVELDEEVVDLASKYAISRLESPVECIVTDANAYIMQCYDEYDMICVDLFVNDKVPSVFESYKFLKRCSECLRPGGKLLFNHIVRNDQEATHTEDFYKKVFQQVFPEGFYLEPLHNKVFVGIKAGE